MITTTQGFIPIWSNLLVQLADVKRFTEGGLWLPTNTVTPDYELPASGVVLKRGEEAPEALELGARVIFNRSAATIFKDDTALVAAAQVDAYIPPGDAGGLGRDGINKTWAPLLNAPTGQLLVQRSLAKEEGIIERPGITARHVISNEAVVRALAPDLLGGPFEVGSVVFLHPTVRRGFRFSLTDDDFIWNRCAPVQIAGLVEGEIPDGHKAYGDGAREAFFEHDPHEDRFHEGDRRGF